jgi:hypothetical protein
MQTRTDQQQSQLFVKLLCLTNAKQTFGERLRSAERECVRKSPHLTRYLHTKLHQSVTRIKANIPERLFMACERRVDTEGVIYSDRSAHQLFVKQ